MAESSSSTLLLLLLLLLACCASFGVYLSAGSAALAALRNRRTNGSGKARPAAGAPGVDASRNAVVVAGGGAGCANAYKVEDGPCMVGQAVVTCGKQATKARRFTRRRGYERCRPSYSTAVSCNLLDCDCARAYNVTASGPCTVDGRTPAACGTGATRALTLTRKPGFASCPPSLTRTEECGLPPCDCAPGTAAYAVTASGPCTVDGRTPAACGASASRVETLARRPGYEACPASLTRTVACGLRACDCALGTAYEVAASGPCPAAVAGAMAPPACGEDLTREVQVRRKPGYEACEARTTMRASCGLPPCDCAAAVTSTLGPCRHAGSTAEAQCGNSARATRTYAVRAGHEACPVPPPQEESCVQLPDCNCDARVGGAYTRASQGPCLNSSGQVAQCGDATRTDTYARKPGYEPCPPTATVQVACALGPCCQYEPEFCRCEGGVNMCIQNPLPAMQNACAPRVTPRGAC
jgi:hypothetical protein